MISHLQLSVGTACGSAEVTGPVKLMHRQRDCTAEKCDETCVPE